MEDCPDGRMDREKMKIMFAAIMPKVKWNKWTWKEIKVYFIETRYFCQGAAGEQYLDQLFRIFDKDGDGSIDFKVELSNSTNSPKGSFEKYEYHS